MAKVEQRHRTRARELYCSELRGVHQEAPPAVGIDDQNAIAQAIADAEARGAEQRQDDADDNPTCVGEWLSGSGGHRVFGGCGKPATWVEHGTGAAFCDAHFPVEPILRQRQGGADGRELWVYEPPHGDPVLITADELAHGAHPPARRYVPAESRPQQESGWVPVAANGAVPRASVRWFSEQMELALRRNDHKGGWHSDYPIDLAKRVEDEANELFCALDVEDEDGASVAPLPDRVIAEAADVANMAHMVADHFRPGGPSVDQGHTLPAPPASEEP